MNNQQFLTLYNSVSEHNFTVQKQLSKENVFTISQLKKLVQDFPLADIFLHYPPDSDIDNLSFCYSVHHNTPSILLPVKSFYASADKIVLSYLSQDQFNTLDFSNDFLSHEHYMNSVRVTTYLYNDNWIFTPSDGAMIFLEHIDDSLGWPSDSSSHKSYHAFSLIMSDQFMSWYIFYFTPHY